MEFTRDTYILLWWYVRQPESLTVESVVPRPCVSGHPVSLAHSTRTVSPSIMHVHVRGMETTHISRFDGMSVNRIHSPSNPPCLAPCLWSPCLAHSHTLYSLSVHYAYTLVSDTYGYGSCHSVWCHIEYILIHPIDRHLSTCLHSNNQMPTF